ncbi:pullulanase [Sinobaca qinghaiensis]|uniref:Pullulanase n=1 Tax=Sinobaca qinghaiensis TaxID=342944 RepID=A0A419UW17_9BACL|nr:type I pullulanase [Sinobaca qinghaiensis]RKD68772.1 pullulanase [Sinobaca qinghaiensis]
MNASAATESRTIKAFMNNLQIVTIIHTADINMEALYIVQGHEEEKLQIENMEIMEDRTVLHMTEELEAGVRYRILSEEEELDIIVEIGESPRSPEFEEKYYYDGNDLGAVCENSRTNFAVWTPVAEEAYVLLVDTGNTDIVLERLPMKRTEKGVYRFSTIRSLHEAAYQYEVLINGDYHRTADPYAVSSTVNGHASVVIDTQKLGLGKPVSLPAFSSPVDAVIYEVHMRDFSAHYKSGMYQKGKFGAWTKMGKNREAVSPGLTYIKDLGATHVQILPLQDFGSIDEKEYPPAYNWGYDPIHHFVPEGSYAGDPLDPTAKVKECWQFINHLHAHGLRLVLDVVYNHFYNAETSPLSILVPGYFFRFTDSGELSNGTGVGNDTASERGMMRKYILDSLKHWMDFYHVDGFRFDLMGIHDIETIRQAEELVSERKKDSLFYGEGWDLDTSLPPEQRATLEHAGELPAVGFFNDGVRDFSKGSHMDLENPGFVNGGGENASELPFYLSGSVLEEMEQGPLFESPQQSINYVECHDNYTLWDQLVQTRPEMETEDIKRMHRLASSIVILSQGVPFLHAGQEFYRTKHEVENSYKSPIWINQLDWEQKNRNAESINYIKNLLEIRKKYAVLRLDSKEAVRSAFEVLSTENGCTAVKWENEVEELQLFFNASPLEQTLPLNEEKTFHMIVDGDIASLIPLRTIRSNEITIPPLSTVVLVAQV